MRVTARVAIYQEAILPPLPASAPQLPAPREYREVWFTPGAPVTETPVYERASLQPGMTFSGPAIIEQLDATTPLDPRDRATVATDGSLIVSIGKGDSA